MACPGMTAAMPGLPSFTLHALLLPHFLLSAMASEPTATPALTAALPALTAALPGLAPTTLHGLLPPHFMLSAMASEPTATPALTAALPALTAALPGLAPTTLHGLLHSQQQPRLAPSPQGPGGGSQCSNIHQRTTMEVCMGCTPPFFNFQKIEFSRKNFHAPHKGTRGCGRGVSHADSNHPHMTNLRLDFFHFLYLLGVSRSAAKPTFLLSLHY